jgi:hypothetical protein
MNEKEKAQELVDKYIDLLPYSSDMYEKAKQFSIICVDEILKTLTTVKAVEYWNRVKQEIEKL